MMGRRLLYEINTRCWLREIAQSSGTVASVADVPEAEFRNWSNAGITHIWLMGVWSTGSRGIAVARSNPELVKHCREVLPDCSLEDIGPSPYAISGYTVSAELGGEGALRSFRAKLHDYGLRLILDFIPNHVGFDHPFLARRPQLFVRGKAGQEGCFPLDFSGQTYWIAHGRDPYFPPWEDTAQLDYRLCETRIAMASELMGVAARCDGVRCDMAMLVLKEVFKKTWAASNQVEDAWEEEFWESAISEVKNRWPEFEFVAEAYWGLENRLCALGFDFSYDKTLCDLILNHESKRALLHLTRSTIANVSSAIHFLENHDERRVASVLDLDEHRAAALLCLSLPGMPLLYDGQLQGRKLRSPVQLMRRPREPFDHAIAAMYVELLAAIRSSRVGRGICRIVAPEPDAQVSSVFAILWEDEDGADLVLVNLSASKANFTLKLSSSEAFRSITIKMPAKHPGSKLLVGQDGSASFELAGHEAQILSLRNHQ